MRGRGGPYGSSSAAGSRGRSGRQDAAYATYAFVTRNGFFLPQPVPITAGTVTLQEGTYLIEWTVTDPDGNSTSAQQTVDVALRIDESCCPLGSQVIYGTEYQNVFYPTSSACIFALGGGDMVVSSSETDFIVGGDGSDMIVGFGGDDVFLGGNAQDHLTPSFPFGGNPTAFGMGGGDAMYAIYSDSATLYGGAGHDHLVGSYGDDYIVPGPGRDAVAAMLGNDTVVIYNECELEWGKYLDGGTGDDTLIIPVPASELSGRGVTQTGFEHVLVDTSQVHLSECL